MKEKIQSEGLPKEPEKGSGESGYSVYILQRHIDGGFSKALSTSLGDIPIREVPEKAVNNGSIFDFGVEINALAGELGLEPEILAQKVKEGFLGSVLVRRVETQVFTQKLKEKKGKSDAEDETKNSKNVFVNFELNMPVYGTLVVDQILRMGSDFGKENIGKNEVVVFDTSSPNIAKDMHSAHLRSTVIGDALARIYRKLGFEVITDNHIGDWGTQFGKLTAAIKRWSSLEKIQKADDPIAELQKLYVRISDQIEVEKEEGIKTVKGLIKKNGIESLPELKSIYEGIFKEVQEKKDLKNGEINEDEILKRSLERYVESQTENEGRSWFLKLEQGNPEARRIWKFCVDISLKEFQKMYDILGVNFDKVSGESFYEQMLPDLIKRAEKIPSARISEGALIIDMQDVNLGVQLVRTSDGRTLYFTRDMETGRYREQELGADRLVYVVGADQKFYFEQLFEVFRRMGLKVGDTSTHVYFGMVTLPGGEKMSSRKGTVILLKDVVMEGLSRARKTMEDLESRNPHLREELKNRDQVVRQIAIGALKWNDLSQDPRRNIVFDWDKALQLEGNSSVYAQYAAVRAERIVRNSGKQVDQVGSWELADLSEQAYTLREERALVRQLAVFPEVIKEAQRLNNPSKIAIFVYELAKRFNAFYGNPNAHVLRERDQSIRESRIRLSAATYITIKNALDLLGIEVPEAM